MDTQLSIPSYLNTWGHGEGKYGMVVCCETTTGVGVVENLIENWDGGVLIIFLRKIPNISVPNCRVSSNLAFTAQDWILYFNELCVSSQSGRLRCALFNVVSTGYDDKVEAIFSTGMYLFNTDFLSFVYIDVYEGYHSYRDSIVQWLTLLPRGAMLFGSRYTEYSLENCGKPGAGDEYQPCVSGPKAAIDAAAYLSRRTVLSTYAEESGGSEWSGANKYCRSFRRIQYVEQNSLDRRNLCERYSGLDTTAAKIDCGLDSSWVHYSRDRQISNGLPRASECHLRPYENDCAPGWYFHVVSRPLPL